MAVAETVDHRSFLGMLDPADRAALLRLGGSKRFRAGASIIPSASMGVSRSLAGFPVELVDRYGIAQSAAVDLNIPVTQEELASLISSSRDSAVRGLSKLRAKGLIATARRRITVTDLDGLRRYASGVSSS